MFYIYIFYNIAYISLFNQEITQKIKDEQEEITKAFLQRIFPEIKVSEKTHEQWLKSFEDKLCAILNELKQKNTDQTNPDLEKQNKNLQGMVSHYKQIIYDTVSFIEFDNNTLLNIIILLFKSFFLGRYA